MSPFQKLLKSRKFLIAVLDVVLSSAAYFVAKYAAPSMAEDVMFLIAAYQPMVLILIGGIAYEDGQAKRNGSFPPAVG